MLGDLLDLGHLENPLDQYPAQFHMSKVLVLQFNH